MIHTLLRQKNDASAVAAVSSVRPAPRDVFLPPEAYAAVASAPSQYDDFDFIQEHVAAAGDLFGNTISVEHCIRDCVECRTGSGARKNGGGQNHPRYEAISDIHGCTRKGPRAICQEFCGRT